MLRCVRLLIAPAAMSALALAVVGCSKTATSTPAPRASTRSAAPSAAANPSGPMAPGAQGSLAPLGVKGEPSGTEPPGLKVTAFTATTPESPLKTLGVEVGDIITSCNGEQRQMGQRIQDALTGLRERGEPITLVVLRDGKQLTLERKEKLPETGAAPGSK